jgi:hypothetical protein
MVYRFQIYFEWIIQLNVNVQPLEEHVIFFRETLENESRYICCHNNGGRHKGIQDLLPVLDTQQGSYTL